MAVAGRRHLRQRTIVTLLSCSAVSLRSEPSTAPDGCCVHADRRGSSASTPLLGAAAAAGRVCKYFPSPIHLLASLIISLYHNPHLLLLPPPPCFTFLYFLTLLSYLLSVCLSLSLSHPPSPLPHPHTLSSPPTSPPVRVFLLFFLFFLFFLNESFLSAFTKEAKARYFPLFMHSGSGCDLFGFA